MYDIDTIRINLPIISLLTTYYTTVFLLGKKIRRSLTLSGPPNLSYS